MKPSLSVCLAAWFLSACHPEEKPLAQFAPDVEVTEAERASMTTFHEELSTWQPTHSASVSRGDQLLRIRIHSDAGMLMGTTWECLVFSAAGELLEAHLLRAGNSSTPKSLLSLEPLRVAAERYDAFRYTCLADSNSVGWRAAFTMAKDRDRRVRLVLEQWRRSGGTNYEAMWDDVWKAMSATNK